MFTKILFINFLFIGLVFSTTPAHSVTTGDIIICDRYKFRCYLMVKSGKYAGYPSRDIIPRSLNIGYCTIKPMIILYSHCSCLELLEHLKSKRNALANQLQSIIRKQDGNKYYTSVPWTRKCIKRACRTYKSVQLKPAAFPFKKNQREIGPSDTLENKEDLLEIDYE
eukprot:gene10176-2596_t